MGYGEDPEAGFDNIAYNPDSMETSLDGEVRPKPGNPGAARDRDRYGREIPRNSRVAVRPDSYHAAQALGRDQLGLAGMGALSGLPYGSQILYRPPREQGPAQQAQSRSQLTPQPELDEQPILKPLNAQPTEQRPPPRLNDLNQPGPETVPIRTNAYNVHPSGGGHTNRAYSLPEELYEFPRERLNLRQRIGDGLYGEVWRARADGIMGRRGQIVVAVKMLKGELNFSFILFINGKINDNKYT